VQINEDAGLTFAAALRAYLRQDPDIIMVGEIRDKETAEIAIRASLTGHLVLSTVHTNSAAATVTRLINMGVEPFLIASTLTVVVSQRLIRKICEHCKEEVEVEEEYLERLGFTVKDVGGTLLYRGRGCEKCNNSGYRGRIGIFEVMFITPKIRGMILDRASTDEIHEVAVSEGMITLREAALRQLRRGITTIEEVVKETTLR